jgi:hypothetical protein
MKRFEKHSTFNIQRSTSNERGVTAAMKRESESRTVAQIFNLPYRRVALGRASDGSSDFESINGLRIANPSTLRSAATEDGRYSRVQLCATS